MKLLRLAIDGFGTLRGEHHFDAGRMTLVVDDNERGKSTLLAAIAAALYGLSDDRRAHRPLTPLERWRPWNGGGFGVELEFECGGERYVVRRDFEKGTVAVWTHRGQEVTARFLEGKDEYPVGKVLLGLDAEEFEKCAFVRQEELEQVVPSDEKDRRANPLQARLERAADTRAGNSSAAEALRVLDAAANRYTEPLLDATVRVETAIQRIETLILALDADLHALEHDYASIREPLERLSLIERDDRAAQDRERALNAERRAALESDARHKLQRHGAARAEFDRLSREIAEFAPYAAIPHDLDARFQEVATRFQELERQRESLVANEKLLLGGLERLDGEILSLAAFDSLDEKDAHHFIACATEMRRIDLTREGVIAARELAREALAAEGFDAPAIERLDHRFGPVPEAERELLAAQPRLLAEIEASLLEADQDAATAAAELRAIDRDRHRRAIPGWIAIGLGLGLGLTALLQALRHLLPVSWMALAAVALGLAATGALLLVLARRLRAADRREARTLAAGASDRHEALARRQRINDDALATLAIGTGAAGVADLTTSWGDYTRLSGLCGPLERFEQELRQVDDAHRAVTTQAGNPPDATWLDRAAEGIHVRIKKAQARANAAEQIELLRTQLAELDRRIAEVAGQAREVLAQAGLAPEPGVAWTGLADEIQRRIQAARRHALLTRELAPQAQRGMLDEGTVLQLQQVLALLESEAVTGIQVEPAAAAPRTLAEIERESEQVRRKLDALRTERSELRLRVDESSRRYHRDHPEKIDEREGLERALGRAQRFKAAVDLARETIQQVAQETHRRWAEFLNERVAELLGTVGTRIDHMRFGEDLDFAVKPRNGQQVSRGKALRQLSSGARDQLHLAVRLAISEYLSREESLPLLIDDCFATSDDVRARAGMKLLIEHLAGRHQIVLVTCHRSRFESFAGLDPDLYRDRVHWIDTRGVRAEARAT